MFAGAVSWGGANPKEKRPPEGDLQKLYMYEAY